MTLFEGDKEIIIRDWAVAEQLVARRGYDIKQESIEVNDLNDISKELNAWGVKWKWSKWSL